MTDILWMEKNKEEEHLQIVTETYTKDCLLIIKSKDQASMSLMEENIWGSFLGESLTEREY